MSYLRIFFAGLGFIIFSSLPATAAVSLRDSVLKVFTMSNSMDYYQPWQSVGNAGKTGSAVVISGNRILTNAHVVSDHTFIQVRKDSDPKKYTAKLLAVAHDCDLALLTVEDESFFKGVEPVDFGELPKLQEAVTVLGYPEGGDKLSITEGVISRIEITTYFESSRKLLTVQIDAALNPGNSGGPVLQNGKIVGIAMQGISNSQNIGYMIPAPVINHFFKDLDDGKYDGFPALGIEVTNTENPTLREFYKIKDQKGGVLINKVMPAMAAFDHLKEGDVVFKIDNVAIGEDGTFEFRDNERLSLTYLIDSKQIGEDVDIQFIRDGKMQDVKIKVGGFAQLVPPINYIEKPTYYIYGGLVFTVLSTDLLRAWGNRWLEQSPIDFLYYLLGTGRLNDENKKEIVVLLQILPDNINVGYHQYQNMIIKKINSQEVASFRDLVQTLSNQKDKYTIIETEQKVKFILDNENIKSINDEILKRNNIPFQYSDDVKAWLVQ